MKKLLLTTTIVSLMPALAIANEWETQVGAGLQLSGRTSTDTDIEGSPFFGGYIEGYAAREFGALRFAVDGRGEMIDDKGKDDTYVTGPVHTGVLGVHLGTMVGQTLVGAYAGIGWFDGYDDDSPMSGWTAGVEAEHPFGNGSIFGQIGYAEAIGDEADNEFQGVNARVGIESQLAPNWRGMAALEYAYSPDCFEDCGSSQWGKYIAAEFGVTRALQNGFDVVAKVRVAQIVANTEDTGKDNTLYVGFTKSFGKRPTSALRTPMGAFHAAGWMEPLD